jgi:Transposase, Mutator family
MADPARADVRAELGKVLGSEHADLLREGVSLMLREVMEPDVTRLSGADHHEGSEERTSYRIGYRTRRPDARAGTLEREIDPPALLRAEESRVSPAKGAITPACAPWVRGGPGPGRRRSTRGACFPASPARGPGGPTLRRACFLADPRRGTGLKREQHEMHCKDVSNLLESV